MLPKLLTVLLIVSISSCSLPKTALWNERNTAASIRMPMETLGKVVIAGNITSLVRNPITSNRKRLWMIKKRSEIMSGDVAVFAKVDEQYRENNTIEDLLNKMKMPDPVAGNVDYLIDGKAFFTALHDSVNNAKESIDTRVFIYDNDDVAVAYSDHLKKRSETIKCRVLMDELGSLSSWWGIPKSKMPADFKSPVCMPTYLRDGSKISVRESKNPGLVTDHTKLFIFDQKEAYLGGMNVGREYRYEWHDMMVRLKGPVVNLLKNEFNKAWRLQGGTGDWGYPIKRTYSHRKTIFKNELGIRVLKTSPGKSQIEKSIIGAIRMAKQRIYIQNSYFTSNSLRKELIAAKKRGVDIQLVFPLENDSKLLGKSNVHFVRSLIENEIKVYAYPKFTHVKALIVDDWVCVGSANSDALSMRINEELNIAFTDKNKAQELVKKLFKKDIQKSKRLYELKVNELEGALLKPIIDQL